MVAVVSAGSLTAISRPPSTTPAMRMQLASDLSLDYGEIWRTQPAVRTVISFLARNIASLGLPVYERLANDDRRKASDHPLSRLLDAPNPSTTRFRLINALVHDMCIYDNAFWAKVGDRRTAYLMRIPPWMVRPLGDSWWSVEKWEVKGPRGKVEIPAAQIVHFRGYNPTDPRIGSSPMEALRQILFEAYEASRQRAQSLQNGARLGGYLTRPAAAPDWNDPARERFKAGWQAQYGARGSQPYGTPILEDGMEFTQVGQTSEQLQYVEARKLTREEVAAAYFVPPPFVGLLDNATFSNITEQHKNLYQDTLGPWCEEIQAEIELQLLPDFGDPSRYYVEFNMAEKLKGSFEEQAAQLQTSVGGPWVTRNEARKRQNLPPVPGGDELITPLNVIIGGQASPTDSAPKALPAAAPRQETS